MTEKVLVIPARAAVAEMGEKALKSGRGVSQALERLTRPELLSFMSREEAEKDPSFLQLIPYVLLWRGGSVWKYQRAKKGGESRLHGLWSLGVGGHINPGDESEGQGPLPDRWGLKDGLFARGLLRELREEVQLSMPPEEGRTAGLVYDRSNEVGRVHLGVIHFLLLHPECEVRPLDPALAVGRFENALRVKADIDGLESWSALATSLF